MPVATLIAACHSKACAPPPVGTGGSIQQGGSPSQGGPSSSVSQKPWEREYKKGAWERIGRLDLFDALMSRMPFHLVPPDRHEMLKEMFRETISQQVSALGDSPVWMNGGVMVIDHQIRLRQSAIDRIHSTIDYLQETNPVSRHVTIHIEDDLGKEGSYGQAFMRMTEDDPALIRLRANEQNDDLSMPSYASLLWHQNSVPVAKGVWGLMHEWGHTHDRAEMEQSAKKARDYLFNRVMESSHLRGKASRYGQTSPAEMYAESFADWNLTQGSTNNPVTELFAITFGWSM